MSSEQQFDTIIIGQGLAGSLLAWMLQKRGQKILVVDDPHTGSASITAAGIINPITGKRFAMHALTDQFLDSALSLYHELGHFFERTFYHPISTIRIFRSSSEQQSLQKRLKDGQYRKYIGKPIADLDDPVINAPYGAFHQPMTGYLDIKPLLSCVKHDLHIKSCYRRDRFQTSRLKIFHDSVIYKDNIASRIIFCTGYQMQQIPWFSSLPMVPTKGDILTLMSTNHEIRNILNNGKWLLPTTDGLFKFGSTYEPHCTNTETTDKNRKWLLEQLTSIINSTTTSPIEAFRVVQHESGIRPCTTDRLPFIGLHPHYPQLGIFNGFGSKGAMCIPYFASLFSEAIIDGLEYTGAGSILRYDLKYKNNVTS